jgi:hypothetical protein
MDVRTAPGRRTPRWTRAFSDELHVLRCACCARATQRGSVTREGLRSLPGIRSELASATQRRCCADATGPRSGLTPDKDPRGRQRRSGVWCNASSGRLRERFGVSGGMSEGDALQRCWLRLVAARGEDRRHLASPRTGPLPEEAARMRVVRTARGPCLCRPLRWAGQLGPTAIACGSCRSPLRWRNAGPGRFPGIGPTAPAMHPPLHNLLDADPAQVRFGVRTPRGGNTARGLDDHRSRDAIARWRDAPPGLGSGGDTRVARWRRPARSYGSRASSAACL